MVNLRQGFNCVAMTTPYIDSTGCFHVNALGTTAGNLRLLQAWRDRPTPLYTVSTNETSYRYGSKLSAISAAPFRCGAASGLSSIASYISRLFHCA